MSQPETHTQPATPGTDELLDPIDGHPAVEYTKTIGEDDTAVFAELSGDYNKIHLDDEAAENSRFGGKVCHGMHTASLITGALSRLVGDEIVLLGQKIEYLEPVRPGTTLTAHAIPEAVVNAEHNIIRCHTPVFNPLGELVVEAEATIILE